MRLAILLAVVLAGACSSKAKDDSPRGRCERGCKRMRECTDERLGTAEGGPAPLETCVSQCLHVGPPDEARLEHMETASCAEVIKPGARRIVVPIQSPGDNK